jgi:L-seryl-tRNA(Ser) seleniumtransferase
MAPTRALLRDLPSIDRLLVLSGTRPALTQFSRERVLRHCRDMVQEIRDAIERGDRVEPASLSEATLVDRLEARLATAASARLSRIVNATGTVLHTNLGRAPLAAAAVDAVVLAARHPVNLEYDVVRGERGRREAPVEDLLRELTGAEAATVVNNNAAATLLALNTLATGRDVLVSRGELIEIGGAFRIPEIMAKSGAVLREVGTTNRTHPADYEQAITDRTGLILKVHTSNYKVVGFVADVPLAQLVDIGRRHTVPVMEDLGSGALVDLGRYGLPPEPVVADRIRLGPDLVTFSGDKALGGPQAGLIVGSRRWVTEIAQNPLHRAVRCGKLTIAALEATLDIYARLPDPASQIPTLRMLTRPVEELDQVGAAALVLLAAALGPEFRLSLEASSSQIGSGALPTEEIPSRAIVIEHGQLPAHRIAERFRRARPPIIGRVADRRFRLDLRAIDEARDLVPNWVD